MSIQAVDIYKLASDKVNAFPDWEYSQLKETALGLMDGLTLLQIRYLTIRQTTASDEDAARVLDLSVGQVRSWYKNKVFKQAMQLMSQGQGYLLGKIIYQQMLPYAAMKNWDMLDAHKSNGEPDWSIISRGVELTQKGSGLVGDRDTQPVNQFTVVMSKLYESIDKKLNQTEIIELPE
jgi:hypothetical protein